jgi:hypothetical protein
LIPGEGRSENRSGGVCEFWKGGVGLELCRDDADGCERKRCRARVSRTLGVRRGRVETRGASGPC